MIMNSSLLAYGMACILGVACATAVTAELRPAAPLSAAAVAPYETQLFNLLMNQRSILDKKNYYQPAFAAQFDALLASSALAKADKTKVSLKKRLLSGPASAGSVVTDLPSGRQFLYYDACQAHRCDDTSLGLLFDPVSRRMIGKLNLDKQSEYLGAPSDSEKHLLQRAESQ